jgi:hypothetical protein
LNATFGWRFLFGIKVVSSAFGGHISHAREQKKQSPMMIAKPTLARLESLLLTACDDLRRNMDDGWPTTTRT